MKTFPPLFAALTLLLCGCAEPAAPGGDAAALQWPVMGTYATLLVRDGDRDVALRLARAAVAEVNDQLSVFDPLSDVARINAAAGTEERVRLQPGARAVLEEALAVHRASHGAFNPLIGPLMEAWGFARGGRAAGAPARPDAEQIARALDRMDPANLEVDETGAVRLRDSGMRLDFGAIAKGYAVDVAFSRLQGAGYSNVLVNLGGNMRAVGTPGPTRDAWRVAVRDPRGGLTGTPLGLLSLTDGQAVATSGGYEQGFEIDGRRYSHLMDPRTGQPVSGRLQVTVLAPTAMTADALSTACFVLGEEASRTLLALYPGASALFVEADADGRLSMIMTAGFADAFIPAEEDGHAR